MLSAAVRVLAKATFLDQFSEAWQEIEKNHPQRSVSEVQKQFFPREFFDVSANIQWLRSPKKWEEFAQAAGQRY